jgi:hypothetical protein
VSSSGELYFDGTTVAANASVDSLKPRFFGDAHLENLFGEAHKEATESAEQEVLHEERAGSDASEQISLPFGEA